MWERNSKQQESLNTQHHQDSSIHWSCLILHFYSPIYLPVFVNIFFILMSLNFQENTQFINHGRLLISTLVSLAGCVYPTCYEQYNFFQKSLLFKILTNIHFVRIQYMFVKQIYVWESCLYRVVANSINTDLKVKIP